MLSRLLSTLCSKVTALFNINFPPPSHETRHIQWEGEQIFDFFFLKKLYKYYRFANRADYVQIFEKVQIFIIFPTFVYEKKKRKKEWVYIIWTSMRKFYCNFHTFFQQLPEVYIFLKCTNLWKSVIIAFNSYLNFIKLLNTSEFHQIIKHFSNFLKSKHKM